MAEPLASFLPQAKEGRVSQAQGFSGPVSAHCVDKDIIPGEGGSWLRVKGGSKDSANPALLVPWLLLLTKMALGSQSEGSVHLHEAIIMVAEA